MTVCYDKIKHTGGAASKPWGWESKKFHHTNIGKKHTSWDLIKKKYKVLWSFRDIGKKMFRDRE